MINTKTLALAALVTFSSLVTAEACEDKVYYCSDELQDLGMSFPHSHHCKRLINPLLIEHRQLRRGH